MRMLMIHYLQAQPVSLSLSYTTHLSARFILAVVLMEAAAERYQKDLCELFYPSARGYTPLQPRPLLYYDFPDFTYRGVRIGDTVKRGDQGHVQLVGYNVTEPANSLRNKGRVPEGFQPVTLEPGVDYTFNSAAFAHPSVWGASNDQKHPWRTSTSVIPSPKYALTHSHAHSTAYFTRAHEGRLSFECDASQGAYYALPCGASAYECTEAGLAKLRSYMLEHAPAWYENIMQTGIELENGDLCLVTGCTKAPYVARGIFQACKTPSNFRQEMNFPLPGSTEYHVQPIVEANSSRDPSLTMEFKAEGPVNTTDSSCYRHGPIATEHAHCLAIRGFWILLHPSIYNVYRAQVDVQGTINRWWIALPSWLRPTMRSWSIDFPTVPPPLHISFSIQ